MPRLLALILTALLLAGAAVPVAASAATKSKSSSSSKSTSKSKSKSKSKSSADCDVEDWATRDDDCDDYELVNGVPQKKKSSCGGLGFAPFLLGGGVGGRLALRARRRR